MAEWVDIPGATDPTYTTPVLGVDYDNDEFRVKVTDGDDEVAYTDVAYTVQRKHTLEYAIEIFTDATTITDADYGMVDGVFRLITGRPGYDGTSPYPLWEDLTYNTYVWHEGLLLRDEISSPSRQVDIDMTGEYGSMGTLNFSFLNTIKIWKFLDDNGVWLTNRNIKFYVVIGDKFMQVWNGIIEDTARDETGYHVRCTDTFRTVHDFLPPNILSTTSDDVEDQDQGDAVPVTFGDCNYVKLQSTNRLINDTLVLNKTGTPLVEYKVAPAVQYYTSIQGVTQRYPVLLNILTNGVAFTEDQLEGKYLHVKSGKAGDVSAPGEDPDTDELIRIKGNDATYTFPVSGTDWKFTVIYLDKQITNAVPEFWNTQNVGYDAEAGSLNYYLRTVPNKLGSTFPFTKGISVSGWWFEILDITNELVISDTQTGDFLKDTNGNIQLFAYDKDNNRYYSISDLVSSIGTDSQGRTVVRLLNNRVTIDGNIKVLSSVNAVDIDYFAHRNYNYTWTFDGITKNITVRLEGGDIADLINKQKWNDTSPYTIVNTNSLGDGRANIAQEPYWPYIAVDLELDNGTDFANFDDISLGFDFKYRRVRHVSSTFINTIAVKYTLQVIDIYGNPIKYFTQSDGAGEGWKLNNYESKVLQLDLTNTTALDNTDTFRLLPADYYRSAGIDYTGDSLYETIQTIGEGQSTLKNWMKFDDGYTEMVKSGIAKRLRVYMYVSCDQLKYLTRQEIGFYNLGIFGTKRVSAIDGDLYTLIEGAKTSGIENTNNVYSIFRYILEENDNISTDDIDYDNVSTTRNTWWAGRQITDRKNSYDYLNELASNSFVCIYPTRIGKRKLTAWRESDRTPVEHNASNIVRDSIRSYGKTPINKVYNNFMLRYSWDAGFKKFIRSMFIQYIDNYINNSGTKTQYTDFPAIDSTDRFAGGGLDWVQYAGGLPEGSYPDAKDLWNTCNESYIRDKIKTPLMSKSLSDLYWYHDLSVSGLTKTDGTNNSSYKYLVNCVEWLTRQKEYITYSIPVNEDNITYIELLNTVNFTDAVYTDSATVLGWITKITYNTNNDTIELTVMFSPKQEQAVGGDGLIIERGVLLNEDTITETGSSDTITEQGV